MGRNWFMYKAGMIPLSALLDDVAYRKGWVKDCRSARAEVLCERRKRKRAKK